MDKIMEAKSHLVTETFWPKVFTLAERPELLDKTIELIELCLKYDKSNSFKLDFAPLFQKENLSHCFVWLDKNQNVLAHVGSIRKKLTWGEGFSTQVAFLGGICVHPHQRGKGLFRSLFEKTLTAHLSEVAMFFLWSDQPALYRPFGFHYAIGQVEIPVQENKCFAFEKTKFAFLTKSEQDQMKALYSEIIQKKYATIKRDHADWEVIKKMNSADLYLKRSETGKIIGYFFMNKGQDLQGIVHEACLDGQYLEECFKYGSTWLTEVESSAYPTAPVRFMSLVRPGHMNMFSKFIELWTDGQVFINKLGQEKVAFTFNGQSYVEDIGEFLTLLLGPSPAQEFANFFKPIYISGLDSI